MPKEWHDRYAVAYIADDDKRNFYRSIVADKKPYFMRYIYPDLLKQYNTYIKNTDRNCMREFHMSVEELMSIPYSDLTERQIEFLRYYNHKMPVGTGGCVMNRICRRIESEFDHCISKASASTTFDYTIMKSDAEYTPSQYYTIKKLYEDYMRRLQSYTVFSYYERVDEDDSAHAISDLKQQFIRDCTTVCPNEKALCNIVLDICYKKSGTKKFAWDMCGGQIINNLLEKSGWYISYPAKSENGDLQFCGDSFETNRIYIGE